MSDDDWTEGLEAPKKKKRGPLFWIFGCMGCGCLVVLIAVGVVGFAVADAVDVDKQWPQVREVLHFDERPEQPKLLVRWDLFGVRQMQFHHEPLGLQAALTPLDNQAAVDALFDLQSPNLAIATEVEEREVELQGRSVRALRYRNVFDTAEIPEWMRSFVDSQTDGDLGSILRVDLSAGGRFLVLDLMAPPGTAIEDGQLQTFLESFDVWHGS